MKILKSKRSIVIIIAVCLILYLLSAIVPFAEHKEVSEDFQKEFQAEACYGNTLSSERAAYIEDNEEALAYRLGMIESAKGEILISTYTFLADESGQALMGAMLKAAERGVDIKILVDGLSGFANLRNNEWFEGFVANEKVSIKIYNPINLLKPWKIQTRLHDKYMVVDDEMYLLGGRNISNLFLGDYDEEKNIDRELFVYDTKLQETSSIKELQENFEKIWELPDCKEFKTSISEKKKGEVTDKLLDTYEQLEQLSSEAVEKIKAKTVETNKITLLFNPIEAENKEPKLWYALHQLMMTGEDILINTPYIICSDDMYEDLNMLCSQASVSIITNDVASGANPWGCTDYLNEKEEILETGVRVYEFLGEYSSHTKSILVDERISVVGSYNMDMRSTYLNTELMAVVDSVELNKILRKEAKVNQSYSKTIALGEDYVYGEHYQEREISLPKKLMYGTLRFLIKPVRHLL